jgi:ketosteroid isomerase-like protein
MMNLKSILLILCVLAFLGATARNNTTPNLNKLRVLDVTQTQPTLRDSILTQDSLLFAAFNQRDFNKFSAFFAQDLEVFQDNIGVRTYKESMAAFRGLFAAKTDLTRKPILTSIDVYPIKGFGAIQTGEHSFCHTENGKIECSTFKFVHIWKRINGKWIISRIITYGHEMN